MRLPLLERTQTAGFGVRTSHSDPKLKGISILLIFSNIYHFYQKLQCCQKMNFYQSFEIFSLFLGLIISFGALVCKFGNKNVFLMLWHFLWNFFDFPIFSIYRNGNFQFFLKSFPQRFLVLSHTNYQTLSDCANSKSSVINLLVKMSLKNMKKSKWCKTSFDEYNKHRNNFLQDGKINWKTMKNIVQHLCTNDTHVLRTDGDFRSNQPGVESCSIKTCEKLDDSAENIIKIDSLRCVTTY